MKRPIRSRAGRLIGAVAALLITTSGIVTSGIVMSGNAYAGVDPVATTMTTSTTASAAADPGVTATTAPGDDTQVRGIPEDVASALEALAAYRTAARDWKECVRDAPRGTGQDTSGVDAPGCGNAPAAADFGLTAEVITELPAKAAARISRIVAAIEARVACIIAHAGDAETLHACFQQVSDDLGAMRADAIRQRRPPQGDDGTPDARLAERDDRREQSGIDRPEERSREERRPDREVRGDQTRIQPGQDRDGTAATHGG